MPTPLEPPGAGRLRATVDLRRLGQSPGDRTSDGGQRWARVRHGVVASATWWAGLTPEEQHAAFVHAGAMQMRGADRLVFSHTSAAALWGLPRVTAWPERAVVSSPRPKVRSSGLIVRHVAAEGEAVAIGDLRITSLARTIIDVARTEDLPDAVAAADHALHREWCTREQLAAELALVPAGARGRAAAALVVDFAEPGAMSVGESLSRVQMFRLNLPRPLLQVPIEDADGQIGVGDFWWKRQRVVGEFDGRKMYHVTAGMTPDEVTEVLWKEKQREDRIRATERKMARWIWVDALRPRQLLTILGAQGISPTSKNAWFDEVA